ncbi:D-glycero-beta-D-manno-heptose 1,7-bisphosphate 7-phosphatase [Chloroflexota bacterium]
MSKAVFLDRDGVITLDPPHYAHRLDQLALIPGTGEAIRLLNENGYSVIVVTNQAGIAYGYYQEEDAVSFNKAMEEKLAEDGASIDAIYFCPHHIEAKVEKYRLACNCRKPEPGMLLKAEKEQGIDLKESYIVGDKLTDIEAGKRAGCKTILVKTGYGREVAQNEKVDCEFIAEDLCEAVNFILT